MNYDNLKITFLDEKEVLGDHRLYVFKAYGSQAATTDLAILGDSQKIINTTVPDDKSLKGRIASYYLYTSNRVGYVNYIDINGSKNTYPTYVNNNIRPVLEFKDKVSFDNIYKQKTFGYNNVKEVKFGEYPQYAAEKEMQNKLENLYHQNRLHKTDKTYTFKKKIITYYEKENRHEYRDENTEYEEYTYKDKKYIRFFVPQHVHWCKSDYRLSNNEIYESGDIVWLEVSPIEWFIDNEKKRLISKKSILSGIKFETRNKEYIGDFKNSEIYEFVNKYLVRDIIPSKPISLAPEDIKKEEMLSIIDDIKEYLPYCFNPENIKNKVMEISRNNDNEIKKLIDSEKNNTINLKLYDTDTIYHKTILQLTEVLNEAKSNYKHTISYYEMLKIIDNAKKVLFKDDVEFDKDIKDIFELLAYQSMSKLNDDTHTNIKMKVSDILDYYQKEINNYLYYLSVNENADRKLKYDTVDNFKYLLKENILDSLQIIKIRTNDSSEETKIDKIIETIESSMNNKQNNQINNYLTEIRQIKIEILKKIKDFPEFEQDLNELLQFDINRLSNELDIYKTLYNIIYNLNELNKKIDEKIDIMNHMIIRKIDWNNPHNK